MAKRKRALNICLEIERLKAENDSLKHDYGIELRDAAAEIERLRGQLQGLILERDQLLEVQKEHEAKIELLKAEVKVKERSRLAFSLELERRTAEVERLEAEIKAETAAHKLDVELYQREAKEALDMEAQLVADQIHRRTVAEAKRVEASTEIERLKADARLKEADYRVLEDKVCDYEAKLEQMDSHHTKYHASCSAYQPGSALAAEKG